MKCRLNLLKFFKIAKKSDKQRIWEEKSYLFKRVYFLKATKVSLSHDYNKKSIFGEDWGLFIKKLPSTDHFCVHNTVFTTNLRKLGWFLDKN